LPLSLYRSFPAFSSVDRSPLPFSSLLEVFCICFLIGSSTVEFSLFLHFSLFLPCCLSHDFISCCSFVDVILCASWFVHTLLVETFRSSSSSSRTIFFFFFLQESSVSPPSTSCRSLSSFPLLFVDLDLDLCAFLFEAFWQKQQP
jgi:hypothetical protein